LALLPKPDHAGVDLPDGGRRARPGESLSELKEFWPEEAVVYLGLDRLGLSRSDMDLQRLIKKKVLREMTCRTGTYA